MRRLNIFKLIQDNILYVDTEVRVKRKMKGGRNQILFKAVSAMGSYMPHTDVGYDCGSEPSIK